MQITALPAQLQGNFLFLEPGLVSTFPFSTACLLCLRGKNGACCTKIISNVIKDPKVFAGDFVRCHWSEPSWSPLFYLFYVSLFLALICAAPLMFAGFQLAVINLTAAWVRKLYSC